MSGPSTATILAAGSLALGAVGTGMSVMGQMNASAAAGAQQAYLAQQSRLRASLLDQQAKDAIQRGDVAADRQRTITAQRIGTQTAVLAGQGTDLSGSPSDILGDTAKAGELDASTIRANAAREAWGYKAQEAGADADANFRASYTPSNLGAGASLLMGASNLADKWRKFQFPDTPAGPGVIDSSALGGNGSGSLLYDSGAF